MMRKYLYLLFISLLLSTPLLLAQDEVSSIISDLNTVKGGEGRVTVMQESSLNGILATYKVRTDTTGVVELTDDIVRGYRIQVYSGNNQTKSMKEAQSRGAMIRKEFKEHQIVVEFKSPFWILRVGNFLTRTEAEDVMKDVKQQFPSISKEMYVVQTNIRRPRS